MRCRLRAIAAGRYELVYVAPERLAFGGFRALLRDLDCPLVAVDEAHCISEWGHDFRPEYMQIGEVLATMPHARLLACTATATPVVRDEILSRLGLEPDTPQLIHGFARPNLALRVSEIQNRRERERQIDALLTEALGHPGANRGCAIIYTPTRKITEEEARRLEVLGWQVGAYHAGLDGQVRDQVQQGFADGSTEVITATNAFGMGIDRPDVRAVAHLAPPGSIEAYYQEVGRAGRDGQEAFCLLLISAGDMALRRHLIEIDVEGRTPDPETVRHKWNLFLELMRWAEGGSCRHDAILDYFGDEKEALSGCGRCDVCLALDNNDGADPEEVSIIVRKALCAVARIHGRFGLQTAVKLLRGAADARLLRAGLDQTPTYGVLQDRSEEWLVKLLRRCVAAGWVDFYGGARPVVVLTEEGHQVIHAKRAARLLLPSTVPKTSTTTLPGVGKRRVVAADQEMLDNAALDLFDALRRYRLEAARHESVPPYVIASDRTLRAIAVARPQDMNALEQIHGIGPTKAARYGAGLLKIVTRLDAD